jgi:hypothetical protein
MKQFFICEFNPMDEVNLMDKSHPIQSNDFK